MVDPFEPKSNTQWIVKSTEWPKLCIRGKLQKCDNGLPLAASGECYPFPMHSGQCWRWIKRLWSKHQALLRLVTDLQEKCCEGKVVDLSKSCQISDLIGDIHLFKEKADEITQSLIEAKE